MKKTMVVLMVAVMMTAATLVLLPVEQAVAVPQGTAGIDKAGEDTANLLKQIASGPIGRALFFGALLFGIVAMLSQKHRSFGLIALGFGLLLGLYGGLADGLWSWFTGMGGGGR